MGKRVVQCMNQTMKEIAQVESIDAFKLPQKTLLQHEIPSKICSLSAIFLLLLKKKTSRDYVILAFWKVEKSVQKFFIPTSVKLGR